MARDTNLEYVRPVRAGDLLVVTFGRNVDDTPMPAERWAAFQHDAVDQLGALLRPRAVFGPFTGHGGWEGIAEESACLTMIVGTGVLRSYVDTLLSELATTYAQDAIAWSHGPNFLSHSVDTGLTPRRTA